MGRWPKPRLRNSNGLQFSSHRRRNCWITRARARPRQLDINSAPEYITSRRIFLKDLTGATCMMIIIVFLPTGTLLAAVLIEFKAIFLLPPPPPPPSPPSAKKISRRLKQSPPLLIAQYCSNGSQLCSRCARVENVSSVLLEVARNRNYDSSQLL